MKDAKPELIRSEDCKRCKPPKKYLIEDHCLECGTRIYIAQDTLNNMWQGYHQHCWACDGKKHRDEIEDLKAQLKYFKERRI